MDGAITTTNPDSVHFISKGSSQVPFGCLFTVARVDLVARNPPFQGVVELLQKLLFRPALASAYVHQK